MHGKGGELRLEFTNHYVGGAGDELEEPGPLLVVPGADNLPKPVHNVLALLAGMDACHLGVPPPLGHIQLMHLLPHRMHLSCEPAFVGTNEDTKYDDPLQQP